MLSEDERDLRWTRAILEGRDVERAFEELHCAYLPLVRGFFSRKGFAPAEIQDLEQELFLMVFKNLSSFKGRSTFRSWIFAVASHHCRDRWKASKRAKRQGHELSLDGIGDSLLETKPGPDGLLLASERTARLNAAIEKLPDRARECVRLRLQDYDLQEIATLLRVKIGTVKAHLFQARQRLAEMLGEDFSLWEEPV